MATAAATVIIAKEKHLVEHFRRAGALSPETAKSAADLGVDTRMAWSILERRGIIRDAGEGLYYLDESAWVALRQRRRRLAIVFLVIALVVLAAGMVATIQAR